MLLKTEYTGFFFFKCAAPTVGPLKICFLFLYLGYDICVNIRTIIFKTKANKVQYTVEKATAGMQDHLL